MAKAIKTISILVLALLMVTASAFYGYGFSFGNNNQGYLLQALAKKSSGNSGGGDSGGGSGDKGGGGSDKGGGGSDDSGSGSGDNGGGSDGGSKDNSNGNSGNDGDDSKTTEPVNPSTGDQPPAPIVKTPLQPAEPITKQPMPPIKNCKDNYVKAKCQPMEELLGPSTGNCDALGCPGSPPDPRRGCGDGNPPGSDGLCGSGNNPNPNPKPGPDRDCLFNPSLPKCKPGPGGNCPPNFGRNEDGNCFPLHHRCPSGYHSHEDDESGRCIPDRVPCDKGFIRNPDFPECGSKDRICREHPFAPVCRAPLPPHFCREHPFAWICRDHHGGNDDHDNDHSHDNHNDHRIDIIIRNINNIAFIEKTIVFDRSQFPNIDIIGLAAKHGSGEAVICLMDISSEDVQCQGFSVSPDRISSDITRIIELDHDKNFDNGGTGSSKIDDVIKTINDGQFNSLDKENNHDFGVDLAPIGINDNGEGMVCLVTDSTSSTVSNPGKSLCEPFKVEDSAVSGQITEIVGFE